MLPLLLPALALVSSAAAAAAAPPVMA
eukprot:SAG31_NODE_39314_length_289_cov_0.815789_1_plen_26_part_10